MTNMTNHRVPRSVGKKKKYDVYGGFSSFKFRLKLPSLFPTLSAGCLTPAWDEPGSQWSFSTRTSMSPSEWGPLWETVGGRCLTGHQFSTRSRRGDPPNSPYPEPPQTPPSPILQDFPCPSRCPGDMGCHNGELKTREQKVRYDFHSAHLSSVSAMDEMELLEGGKISYPRPCIPRHLNRRSMRVNLLPVGWLPSGGRVASKTSKHYSNTAAHP